MTLLFLRSTSKLSSRMYLYLGSSDASSCLDSDSQFYRNATRVVSIIPERALPTPGAGLSERNRPSQSYIFLVKKENLQSTDSVTGVTVPGLEWPVTKVPVSALSLVASMVFC